MSEQEVKVVVRVKYKLDISFLDALKLRVMGKDAIRDVISRLLEKESST